MSPFFKTPSRSFDVDLATQISIISLVLAAIGLGIALERGSRR
jgi:hypothetical protein